ncbi:MAG: hypothetical protein IPK19_20720 [Chloroflexi bacterium]|nr:hypothetical protein [Chloroflexota bacterium]
MAASTAAAGAVTVQGGAQISANDAGNASGSASSGIFVIGEPADVTVGDPGTAVSNTWRHATVAASRPTAAGRRDAHRRRGKWRTTTGAIMAVGYTSLARARRRRSAAGRRSRRDVTDSGSGIAPYSGATVDVNGASLTANTALGSGGGIWSTGGTVTIQGGAQVTANDAGNNDSGSGVYVAGESADLTVTGAGTAVSGNLAASQGGGIYANSGADVIITNTATVSNNPRQHLRRRGVSQ